MIALGGLHVGRQPRRRRAIAKLLGGTLDDIDIGPPCRLRQYAGAGLFAGKRPTSPRKISNRARAA